MTTLYPNLEKLKISGNIIEKIDNLLKLKPLKLRKIEVKENPFSIGNDKYKNKLFDMLPSLKIIDQSDKYGEEIETTDYKNEEEENEGSEFAEEEEVADKEEEDGEEEDDDDEGEDKEEDK